MADVTTPIRLIRRLRRRTARPVIDFADYGTAFGLEMSLLPDDTQDAPAARPARDPGWWRRLGWRKRPVSP